jgi:hypothetical protein
VSDTYLFLILARFAGPKSADGHLTISIATKCYFKTIFIAFHCVLKKQGTQNQLFAFFAGPKTTFYLYTNCIIPCYFMLTWCILLCGIATTLMDKEAVNFTYTAPARAKGCLPADEQDGKYAWSLPLLMVRRFGASTKLFKERCSYG